MKAAQKPHPGRAGLIGHPTFQKTRSLLLNRLLVSKPQPSVSLCVVFSLFHAIAHGKFRFVFPRRGKAEELSEPSVVEIAGGRVAVRLDPFGVLDPK